MPPLIPVDLAGSKKKNNNDDDVTRYHEIARARANSRV